MTSGDVLGGEPVLYPLHCGTLIVRACQYRHRLGETFVANVTYPAADSTLPATLNVREKDEDERVTPAGLKWRWLDPWRVEVTKPSAQSPTAVSPNARNGLIASPIEAASCFN